MRLVLDVSAALRKVTSMRLLPFRDGVNPVRRQLPKRQIVVSPATLQLTLRLIPGNCVPLRRVRREYRGRYPYSR
jgi:hypothetical protein